MTPTPHQPDIDIEALRKAAEAATAGPWHKGPSGSVYSTSEGYGLLSADTPSGRLRNASANEAYIAAANPATIIALLNERDALLDRLERAEAERDEFKREYRNAFDGLVEANEKLSRAQAAAGAVPEGFKLVPVAPTEAMMHAAEDVPAPRPYGAVYRAMIAAAPPAQGLPAAPNLEAERMKWWKALQAMECPYTEATSGGLDWQVSAHAWTDAIISVMRVIYPKRATPPAAAPSEPVAMMTCGKCGKDRLTEGCQRLDCEFVGTALATPPAQDAGTGDAWISLNEDIPANGQRVLVALDTGVVLEGFRVNAWFEWADVDREEVAGARATHWQPWPEAPKQCTKEEGDE